MTALVEIGDDWGAVHPRTSWFDVRPLAEGVTLIAEPGHVNNCLVVGEDRAVLLDTGSPGQPTPISCSTVARIVSGWNTAART